MLTDLERRQLMKRVFARNPERQLVLDWMLLEWDRYAGPKFNDGSQHDDEQTRDGFMRDGFWNRHLNSYMDRVLDAELPVQRQAAMKMATTLVDGLAAMCRIKGLPPAPGHPSGELEEWSA